MFQSIIPWRDRLPATFPQFENEMEDLMERFFGNGGDLGLRRFTPSLNVSETETDYEVAAELPGIEPDDVSVELRDGALWVSGKKEEEKEEKGKTFHRIERRHGEFRRVVHLPGAVNEDQVEAKFDKGVLTIRVPKSEAAKTRQIPIKG